jgi:hypothetical protein
LSVDKVQHQKSTPEKPNQTGQWRFFKNITTWVFVMKRRDERGSHGKVDIIEASCTTVRSQKEVSTRAEAEYSNIWIFVP